MPLPVALGITFSRSMSAPTNQVLSRTSLRLMASAASSSITPVFVVARSSGIMWVG